MPFGLVTTLLQLEKASIRRVVKHQLMESENDRDFVLLTIANQDLNTLLEWEHEREFEYLGEMYDVVRSETRTDSTYFVLWWDHDETEINKKLARLVKSKQASDSPNPVAKKLVDFEIVSLSEDISEETLHVPSVIQNDCYRESFLQIYLSLPDPPPDLIG